MSQISTKPPSGMRDFLAEELVKRRHVIGVIQEVYESFGFVPLETPTIENLSTLLGKYGPEGDQLLYRILHRREHLGRAVEDVARQWGKAGLEMPAAAKWAVFFSAAQGQLSDEGLRYDLTVPLARVVANYRDLPAFYKRYQIQPVWRADRPAKGRFREFYQCDVDVTGTTSIVADAEVCAAVASVLSKLGFDDFKIEVNHRELLRALVSDAGIPLESEGTALIALDKLDKIGRDGVLKELDERGIGPQRGEALMSGLEAAKTPGFLEERAKNTGASGAEGARSLLELFALATQTPAQGKLRFAPELARGLSYYTGPIFEVSVPGLAGSMGGGGRYDGLIGMFTKQRIPAVGFSLGLERILLVMEERAMFPALAAGPQILVCRFPDVTAAESLRAASDLRAQGLRVELYPETEKLGKQLAYATTIKASYAAVLGRAELDAGKIALKNLTTGEQRTLFMSEVAAVIRG
ncbi:MAG TPA: histidine--tRNA ligase [Planctomycetota bacterium]|nr:histidine--tRNA ligase [Planctomycetota bacterium]